MNAKNKLMIFSHGMGVLKDNRGLFPYLVERLTSLNFDNVMFDYNDIDEQTKEVTVKPFSVQAQLLQKQIAAAVKNGYKKIVVIGQSQGSLIPTYCDTSGIDQVIGISPFFHTAKEAIIKSYSKQKANIIDFEGTTRRQRSDGTVTIMPKEYWDERFKSNPEEAYNALAQKTQLTLINALQDEIMEFTNLKKIKYARLINTDGDHDFTGEYRDQLATIIYRELVNLL